MNPDTTKEIDPNTNEENIADEKACIKRIGYWLKRYSCTLQAEIVLTEGSVRSRVSVTKIPPEVLKQIKKAEKDGARPTETSA